LRLQISFFLKIKMARRVFLKGDYIVNHPREVNLENWSKALAKFVDNTLRPVIRDNRKRAVYTSPKYMPIWEAAFTHPGFNSTQGKNYEELEFIGDRALKYAFNKYTISRFPEYDKSDLSDMETTYMSETWQPTFGKKMNLDKFALITKKYAKPKVLEDLFEAFMGALDTVSEDIEPGLGIVNVRNFVTWFFNKESLSMDIRSIGGVIITRVRQIFERFNKRAVRDERNKDIVDEWSQEDDGIMVLKVRITPGMRDILEKNFKINFRGNYLGQAKGRDKKEVTINAYRDAAINLEKLGITFETSKLVKELYDFAEPELLPYRVALARKLRDDGYVRAYFDTPKKLRTDQDMTLLLMLEDEYGNSVEQDRFTIPKTTDSDKSAEVEAKALMIRNYVGAEETGPTLDVAAVEREDEGSSREQGASLSREERAEDLKTLKIPMLKDILRASDLKVGGNKSVLIERILDSEF